MLLHFTKMQGAGNDFIVIDAMAPGHQFDPDTLGRSGRARLADRHLGIGCDQLLVLHPPRHDKADVWIRIFNADGGEAAQCGNGMRCITRYLHDSKPDQQQWSLDSAAGLMQAIAQADGSVSVDMGPPEMGPEATGCLQSPLLFDSRPLEASLVSMGNPHAVLFVDDIDTAPVQEMGFALQQCFRDGVNVGFAQVVNDAAMALRVWERGVGETRACGSGACAAAVAAQNAGKIAAKVAINQPGGQLVVKWGGNGESVWLRGPAQRVFEGQTEL